MTAQIGILEQEEDAETELASHAEAIRLKGFSILPSGFSRETLSELAQALSSVYRRQIEEFGGSERLAAIGDEWTVRALLAYDETFLTLAAYPALLQLAAHLLGNYVLLNQQNGLINPPNAKFGQTGWHRDLPYQHFVVSRPIAISAIFCIDPFTADNGATLLLPGSHKSERFPSKQALEQLAQPVEAPAGSFIVFDSMLYHRAGDNKSSAPRRGVNQVYTRAFIRQQIDLPAMLEGRYSADPALARLLGYSDRAPASVLAWRRSRLERARFER